MASVVILIPCALVLLGTAIPLMAGTGQSSMANPGAHGFSELLYNYSSMGNNNGSAFGGFNANVPFHNILGGVVMWISRFWITVPILAIAGSLARKKTTPSGPGTLATHSPLFITLLISIVLIVGALTFIPALALGPIAEQITYATQN
jgi:K+-transporting ATPase ATPase A chain